jgi:hypothetical protein
METVELEKLSRDEVLSLARTMVYDMTDSQISALAIALK